VHYRTNLSGCIFATKALSTIGTNFLNSNMSSTCPHNINAWDCWRVWGTPANFNGFCILPSLLQQRRLPEANQTLHDVWPSPGLLHYIYIFGGYCPLTEFCPVQRSLYVQVLHSSILVALLHSTPAAGISQTLRRGTRNGITELSQRRHLYSAGRPSRWASAHILVHSYICIKKGWKNATQHNKSDE